MQSYAKRGDVALLLCRGLLKSPKGEKITHATGTVAGPLDFESTDARWVKLPESPRMRSTFCDARVSSYQLRLHSRSLSVLASPVGQRGGPPCGKM